MLNKSDKGIEVGDVQRTLARFSEEDVLYISAKEGAGLSAFENWLERTIRNLNRYLIICYVSTRVRHQQAVRQAVEHLQASSYLSVADQTELVAEEFRSATSALSRILGQVDIEDVLDHIFASFCIGK